MVTNIVLTAISMYANMYCMCDKVSMPMYLFGLTFFPPTAGKLRCLRCPRMKSRGGW
jgi:hypothetical protein